MNYLTNLLAPALAIRATSFYKVAPARPTVAGALVHFHRAKEELMKVKQHHDAEAERQTKALLTAGVAKAQAEAESASAVRSLAKIEDFLS